MAWGDLIATAFLACALTIGTWCFSYFWINLLADPGWSMLTWIVVWLFWVVVPWAVRLNLED